MAEPNSIGHATVDYCPITGLSIDRRPQWQDLDLGGGYRASFALIGRRILLMAPSGNAGSTGMERLLEERAKFLKEVGLFGDRYVELKDYSLSGGRPSREGRLQFTRAMSAESAGGNLLGFWGFEAPQMVRWAMSAGTLLVPHSIPFKIVSDYRTAILEAMRVLDALGLSEAPATERSGWSIRNRSCSVTMSLLGSDILFSRVTGALEESDVDQIYALQEQVINETGLAGLDGYYKLIDTSGLHKTSWSSRRRYASYLHRYHEKVPCLLGVIFGISPVIRAVLSMGSRAAGMPVLFAKSKDDALRIIECYRKEHSAGMIDGRPLSRRDTRAVPVVPSMQGEIQHLLDYLGSINWEQNTEYRIPETVDPLLAPVYEAVTLVKHDFDAAIAERGSLQKQLLVSSRMASIGQLAAGVGHEINNPLTVIVGLTDMLRENKTIAAAPELLRMVDKIRLSADRVTTIVRDLKNFARSESVGLITFDVHEAIQEILALAGRVIEKDDVQIMRDLRASSTKVTANRGHLQQIVVNLLTNARDAVAGSAQKIVRLSTSNSDGKLLLEIADSGCGMDERTRERIFDPFFTTKSVGTGTGLGLSIVHSFVEEMRSTIEVESLEGVGSLFRILIPLAAETVATPVALSNAPRGVLTGRALVVDDETEVREVIVWYLTDLGLSVDSADSGMQGIEQARARHYDWIFSDIKMPGMSGFDMLRRLREEGRQARHSVLISGTVLSEKERDDILKLCDAEQVIEKPVDREKLTRLLLRATPAS